jgi:hypothetical protein
MQEFEFDGNWTFEVDLSAFAGFQSRNSAYTSIDSESASTGTITIEIEDDLTENPDPYPAQINAIKFIFKNQDAIVNSILQRALVEMPDIIINYGLTHEEAYQNLTIETLRSLIGFNSISIQIPSKDDVSYFDVMGGCNWDEEHGLNVLMHKVRTITMGGIEGNSYWDALKDNGTYETVSNSPDEKSIPTKYKPHPKYNKLKPSQEFANETFEHSLISGHHNEIFKALTESGEIDVNGKWEMGKSK